MSLPISHKPADPKSDLDTIFSIISACSRWLLDRNLPDWSHYYTPDRLKNKFKDQQSYLFYQENIPVGVVFLAVDKPYYYSSLDMSKFSKPSSPAYYICTLAVHPSYHHRGIASYIISFCQVMAKNNGINCLRLDCNSQDHDLVTFYKNRGFLVTSSMEKEPEYLLLEKIIN